jgi:hypothetical protein
MWVTITDISSRKARGEEVLTRRGSLAQKDRLLSVAVRGWCQGDAGLGTMMCCSYLVQYLSDY